MALRGTGKSGGATKLDAGSGALVSARTRFLILHGSERFLQDKYIADLRAAMTKAHGEGGFDTVRFDGMAGQRIIADVLDECRSMGLMAQFKVVLVDNADLLLKADDDEDGGSAPAPAARGKRTGPAMQGPRKLLEAYAADPSDNAALVLRAGNWRPGNLDKAVVALEDAGAVIKCESPSEEEAVGWAVKRATQSHATTLAPAAAQALVAAVGADLGRIDSELAKLALAAGGRGEPITEQLVSSMTGVTREDELWGIQSRVLSGDTAEALEFLHLLVDVTRADAVPLTWAYVDLARKVHTASRGLSQGLPRQQVMSSLKAWGPMLDLIINKATRLKPEVAARLLKDAVQTDSAGKSGQGDPVRNLELLTVKMCQAFGVPAPAPSHASRNASVVPSRSGGR